MELIDEIQALAPQLIADRNTLHQHPELSHQEFQTTAFLKQRLMEFGVELEPLNMETGVSALIRGKYPGPTICIRNDMDALPIQETTGLPFASQVEGVSHSCGHDIHSIIAIYCAKLLQERADQLAGNVRIVIQPAEEDGSGAYQMVNAGLMELLPKNDIVVGTHVHPAAPVGTVTIMKGPAEAGSDYVNITVKGVSGHGAYPHLCVDPIAIASYLVTQLQTIISRENMPVQPAVLTFGTISGGTASNVIANEVMLTGTLRTLYPDSRTHHLEAIRRMTEFVCKSMRAEGVVEHSRGLPPVINDPEIVDDLIAATDQILGPGHVILSQAPSMGSDDFSVFLDYSPGAQFFVGSANDSPQTKIGLHRGENIFDEGCLSVGVSVLTQYVLNRLKPEF